jgi:hypothetical protein
MSQWFPHLPVYPYPTLDSLETMLSRYEWIFVVHNDVDLFVKTLISEGKKRFPDRIKVLYLYPSPNIVNERYYGDCLANPRVSIVDNLKIVYEKVLHLPGFTRHNGFTAPQELVYQKHVNRIVIHPTSARFTRNWPKRRFVKLALHLQKKGYEVVLIPGDKDWDAWQDVLDLGLRLEKFPTLDALSRFIYESKYLIGNDSGLGHLASALKIPTLTLCRRKAWAKLWAPSFHKGVVVTPASWIINIRGLRLRDKYWRYFISVGQVLRGFDALCRL